jgi:putative Mg2+ transporter-C (MgtC) family protein
MQKRHAPLCLGRATSDKPPKMTSLTYVEVFLRLSAAVGAGALIGLDRELRRKPAGLRTLALVSLGSALFVLETIDALSAHPDATSRVVQGVVTGVGFLGAGSIIRGHDEESVRGLTTAASIWLAAATGIACGLANWPLVVAACLLGLLVLTITPVERVIHNRRRSDQKDPPPLP